MYLLGLWLLFWEEGFLSDESTQRQQRWAHLEGKKQLQEQKTSLAIAGSKSHQSDFSTSGHLCWGIVIKDIHNSWESDELQTVQNKH